MDLTGWMNNPAGFHFYERRRPNTSSGLANGVKLLNHR